jgi:hypothetical protein
MLAWRSLMPVVALVSLVLAACGDEPVIADKFEIKHKLDGDKIYLSLDTDLPDFPDIWVTVHREFWQVGRFRNYSINYFQEKSIVDKWRSEREIVVDNDVWKKALKADQDKLKSVHTPYVIDRISDEIIITMVIAPDQKDPRMGKQNSNLEGKAVIDGAFPIIKRVVKTPYPIN